MSTYIILSKLSPDAFSEAADFKGMAKKVADEIKKQCPEVKWKESYAITGQFDVIDIVEASHIKEVEKAAMIIRAYGKATTETLFATPWKEFLGIL